MKRYLNRLGAAAGGGVTLAHNLIVSRRHSPMPAQQGAVAVYRGMAADEYAQVLALYADFHRGRRPDWLKRALCRFAGDRLVLVAVLEEQAGPRVVGMDLFYATPRDRREGTIHEGFIGVHPEVAGRGVATALRGAAIAHFAAQGYRGISTRISLDNPASLASAARQGFMPRERYRDPATGCERQYLVRWLRDAY
ncbi:GNAT family N-acetyltransferase [Halomonas nitroreducens]|uniref:GNAT family N-acetyltransferase n=1 Tax=Halomonas nitroreducens TaxID=447425 RepID=A0A431V5J8_9GAMM|nr:GNAT family N-acetyltransferase [Halomonas nitroreducens]RTR05034.1 GNAT family N-acetyltransferase [Halomonas nitroreducens]